MSKIRLNINGKEVIGHKGQTVLDIARENNITIPTMCHDDRVKAYGSCGLCVVEVEGVPKLLRSCATEASDGMVVLTDSPKVKSSRKIALELLLSDHVGDCRPPCVRACPAKTDCQGYVGLIANGQYKEAVKLIKEQLPLPASIGRVCPHPCEEACRREMVEEPISIMWLKRFVADIDLRDKEEFIPEIKAATGKKVAIIGGGPSGLTTAYYLAKEGHQVVIYEAMPKLGGMLRYGIPQYRLPKEVLDLEIAIIEKMGVKMIPNTKIGKDIKFSHLRENFDAVYISIGAWNSTKLNCPGEDLEGVIGGIEFLTKFATNQPVNVGERIAVVGGGNTAMDACRTAMRLGAKEVFNLYRRTKAEMPAEDVEIKEAEEEGINFKFLVSPIEIIGENGKVSKIRLQKMRLGEPDARGRRSPVPIEGEEEIIEVDCVISAIGQSVNAEGFEELELTKRGTIHADENSFITNLPGVFAGGDATNKGPSIAIEAIGEGKRASQVICRYLEGEMIPYKEPYYVTNDDLTEEDFEDREKSYRPSMPHLSPEYRKTNFEEIVAGYSEEDAKKEAARCLECGCLDYFECKLFQLANEYDVNPERLSGEVHKREEKQNHPFILRNPDKCVLCGLCVRTCDEVMGIAALGLTNRGFDAMVQPAFGTPLQETNCISCGQCINVCPTGALQENLGIEKSVPLDTEVTSTVCGSCSVGCSLNIHTKGDLLIKSVPARESAVNEGLACVKGKFGFDFGQKGARLTKPLIRKEGKLQEVSWEEALLYTAKKAQSLGLLYGNDAVVLSVSDRYTNEEAYLVSKLGKEVFNTSKVYSFNCTEEGIETVLGYDASSNTFEELLSTETILLVGTDIMKNHAIAGLKVKKAVENGAKLIVINPFKSQADEWAYKKVTPSNDIMFLKEITKALLENGCKTKAEWVAGLEELKADLKDVTITDEAKEVASLYGSSKKAMIVFEENSITSDAAMLLANIAVLSGHIGSPRSGIIQLKPNANSQGLRDMGVNAITKELVKDIQEGKVKGLLIFGEDPSDIDLSGLDFLMVQDTHLTATAEGADVVLPGASFVESRGSFTNSERRIQRLNQVISPIAKYENWEVILKLANILKPTLKYSNLKEVQQDIAKERKEYFGVDKEQFGEVWPLNESPVLYRNGFNFLDKKARLQKVGDGVLFIEKHNTNHLVNGFQELLTKEKIY